MGKKRNSLTAAKCQSRSPFPISLRVKRGNLVPILVHAGGYDGWPKHLAAGFIPIPLWQSERKRDFPLAIASERIERGNLVPLWQRGIPPVLFMPHPQHDNHASCHHRTLVLLYNKGQTGEHQGWQQSK